jgi:hypothetical protein
LMARWLTMLSISKQPRSKLGLQVVPRNGGIHYGARRRLDLQAQLGGHSFPGVRLD